MDTADHKVASETEIRASMDSWLRSVRARDVDGIVASYAPDGVLPLASPRAATASARAAASAAAPTPNSRS